MPRIREIVEALAETAEVFPAILFSKLGEMVLKLSLRGWEAMQEPDPPFCIPIAQRLGGNRIGQSEGDEGDHIPLLPMRQAPAIGVC